MKVYILHPQTKQFYSGNKLWTEDKKSAKSFSTTFDADEESWMQRLGPIDLFLDFEGPPELNVILRADSKGAKSK